MPVNPEGGRNPASAGTGHNRLPASTTCGCLLKRSGDFHPGMTLRLLYGAGLAYTGLGLDLRVLVLGSPLPAWSTSWECVRPIEQRRSAPLRVGCCRYCGRRGPCAGHAGGVLGVAAAHGLTFAARTAAFVWCWRHGAPAIACGVQSHPSGVDRGHFRGQPLRRMGRQLRLCTSAHRS